MKRLIMAWGLLLLITACGKAQENDKKLYCVAFYNLENLFDTTHDEGKDDAEYLPGGAKKWDMQKYEAKLKNLAQVLGDLGRDQVAEGPAAIGVAEAENRRVLDDLVSQPKLAETGYEVVHYEGPDTRGIDCALLYNPKLFTVTSSSLILSTPFEGDTIHKTRGFLVVDGRMADERVCIIVNHWPSRGAESPVRVHAARQVRAIADSLLYQDKNLKLIVMGDMNDDPMDESLLTLGGKKYTREVKAGDFYNPWWETLEDKGVGTLLYRGKWNLFDQILVSSSFLKAKKGLVYDHNEVFIRNYLFQQDGRYKGSPLRTYGGNEWLNGYSDHLPTILYMRVK